MRDLHWLLTKPYTNNLAFLRIPQTEACPLNCGKGDKNAGHQHFLTMFSTYLYVTLPHNKFLSFYILPSYWLLFHKTIFEGLVPHDSVVKCLTCNPGFLGLSCTGSSGEGGSCECPWAKHFRAPA